MLQAVKNLDAKAAVDKEWEKLAKIPPWDQALFADRWIIHYSTEVHWRFQNYAHEFGC